MKSPGDSHVPVVHIRVIREKKESEFSCDLCPQTFPSTEKLNQHVMSDHSSLDIQDVYVCPMCRCCLLNKNDLLEHLHKRHMVFISGMQQPGLCEFCGVYSYDREALVDHQKTSHGIQRSENVDFEGGRVELTLKDISDMGIGETNCKTLFQLIEYPIEKNLIDTQIFCERDKVEISVNTEIICEDDDGVFLEKNGCVEDTSLSECSTPAAEVSGPITETRTKTCSGNAMPHSIVSDTQGLGQHEPNFDISNNLSDRNEIAEETSHCDDSNFEMIICCNSTEKSTTPESGEIILTVESDKELVWSNDFMSQVISSSGILKRNLELGRTGSSAENGEITYSFQVENKDENLEEGCTVSVEENITKDISVGVRHDEQIIKPTASLEIASSEFIAYADRASKGARQKKCTICGLVFRQLVELEQHESTYHGIRVKCNLCEETFAFSKSLRSHHQRKHSSEGNFHCHECNKSFKCRSNLWSHRMTHVSQEARRFACPECPQRFHTKTKLNVHLQSHTGEKKYQCGECQKGFVYQGLLLRHMRKHFPEGQNFLSDDENIYMVEVGEKTSDESTSAQ